MPTSLSMPADLILDSISYIGLNAEKSSSFLDFAGGVDICSDVRLSDIINLNLS